MSRFALAAIGMIVCALAARPDEPPEPLIPKESFRRAADAEIKFLQKTLPELAAAEKPLQGRIDASKGIAALLVRYSEWLGDDALYSQAVKVLLKLDAKDLKGAAEESKALKEPKVDQATLKAALPKVTGDIFSPFRGTQTGGLNIDRDIKDMTKRTTRTEDIDITLAELVGVRSATLIELGAKLPPVVADRKMKQRAWDFSIYAANLAARELAIEAAKGEKADRKELRKLLTTLNARCTDCHTTDGRSD
jgi:hypothetical protein